MKKKEEEEEESGKILVAEGVSSCSGLVLRCFSVQVNTAS